MMSLGQKELSHESIKFINTLRQRQNGRHFADDIFKRIFVNKNICILIPIPLKFVPDGPVNKKTVNIS